MFRIEKTVEFELWLDGLRDQRAQFKIAQRLIRLEGGNAGDWKPVGGTVSELRIDYGPSYRIYYTIRDQTLYLLLSGSTKKDQDRAIKLAKEMLRTA